MDRLGGDRRSPELLSIFIGGGFQMVALKVGLNAFRQEPAMMSGIASGSWALSNAFLTLVLGALV